MNLRIGLRLIVLLLGLCLTAFGQDSGATRVAYDYSKLYDSLNPAIVKIFADGATGSGFLVTKDGLIATNHHVVRNSRYLAVQFADGRKVSANIAILNPQYDIAVLRINKILVAEVSPLRLLSEPDESGIKAGIPVAAFGSPLSQTFTITQGIISKVEEGVVLGDFLLQPGNSGGPLVTLTGDVIGINTFAEGGISGAVRVARLREIVRNIDLATLGDEPASQLLPTLNAKRYPTEILKEKILNEKLDWQAYRFDAGKFVVTAITPVLVGKTQIQTSLERANNRFQRRGKKIADPSYRTIDEPFYEWHRNATSQLDSAVTFEIKPDFGLTGGSKWALFAGAVAAGMAAAGNRPYYATPTNVNIEYKAEFLDFKLYRDKELIHPVHPGRQITETSLAEQFTTFVDEAYSGWYQYSPDVFLKGNEFRFEVFDAREPEKAVTVTFKGDSKLIKQIRSDFAISDALQNRHKFARDLETRLRKKGRESNSLAQVAKVIAEGTEFDVLRVQYRDIDEKTVLTDSVRHELQKLEFRKVILDDTRGKLLNIDIKR